MATNQLELATQPLNACSQAGNQWGGSLDVDESGNIYQARFDGASWAGTIRKFETTRKENDSLTVPGQAIWDAAIELGRSNYQNRKIFTYRNTTSALVPFRLDQLSNEIQELFNRSPDSGQHDNLGLERVRYLSGDRTMESRQPGAMSAQFRKRTAILGDIINSIPVYEGAATQNIIDKEYPSFFKQTKNRDRAIYIGANDGMLHAFSAENGHEMFGFIPSALLEKLPALTSPAYQHANFMDGKIRVSEAQVLGTWLTVLAAGMGSGARGVFALDVTSPASFINGRGVLFEFTEHDDADMGFVTSAPLIVKLMTAKYSDGTFEYRHFVMVPGGYNPTSTQGDNYLFLLSLDKPAQNAWVPGKNYYKIKTGSQNAGANALAGPGLVVNLQGAATRAYAGDLQGNLWRFDFSAADNPAAHPATLVFHASDTDGHSQPISVAPAVTYAPGGGYAILFGTGKYIENADTNPAWFTGNSFYAIHDQTDQTAKSRNQLASRSLTVAAHNGNTGYRITGEGFAYGEGTANTKKGWFIDFPNSKSTGERMISEPTTAFGAVFFNTFTPGTSCQNPDSGNSYKLDLLTGKTADPESVTGLKSRAGAFGTPILIQTRSDPGTRDALGQRTATQYFSLVNFTSGIDLHGRLPSDRAELKAGRLSWREITDAGM